MILSIKMWIKKIDDYFENMSEYDNNSLALHVAVDLIFEIDKDSNMTITVLKYGDVKEDIEVDEDGFMYWVQMTFHKELIDIILSLKEKYTVIENNNKKLMNESKKTDDESKQTIINETIETNNKEMEALEMIMNKVNTYRSNTFSYLRDKEDIDKMISYIRVYKDQCD